MAISGLSDFFTFVVLKFMLAWTGTLQGSYSVDIWMIIIFGMYFAS